MSLVLHTCLLAEGWFSMPQDLDDFRNRLIAHARLATSRSSKIESEASTNTSLVQPFLTTLGYDVGNPDEVSPEHHADFSDKYQNKVDYAILHLGAPVIAVESKRVGTAIKNDRGQLRSYFNACPTVKLGILTDGLKYEFYADSDKPNMMDETAFLRIDLAEVAKDGAIDDNTLDGIAAIRCGSFNPADVGAEAKRKLLLESIVSTIKRFKTEPSDDFIRFMLAHSAMGEKITKLTQKIVDANRDLVRTAMEAFVGQEALARLGYAPKDVVRAPAERQDTSTPIAQGVTPEPEVESFVPSKDELASLNYAKNRLFFLVRNEVLFQKVQELNFSKTKTTFRVYIGKRNNGSLFDFRELKDGKFVLHFPALNGCEVPNEPSAELDNCLLKSFTQRVTESGISFETSPVLRAIKG